MKCSNCGMDNIINDAVHCPNCGASLITPGNWDSTQQAAPQQQYQQQPPQAPPQQQYPQPKPQYRPAPAKKQYVATVKNIGLTEILLMFSGLFLLATGLENFSYITVRNFGGQFILLGLIAILAGLFILAYVIMPHMLKGLENMMGILLLGISALFVIWGLAASFGSSVGIWGGFITAAGLAGLAAAALKMGYIK